MDTKHTKFFLVSLIAVLAVLSGIQVVIGTTDDITSDIKVTISSLEVSENNDSSIIGFAGETLSLRVSFEANGEAFDDDEETVLEDAKVKAWIGGYRSEILASTDRFEIIGGNLYTKRLSLKLPSDVDPAEEYTLYVRIETKTKSQEATFNLKIQRESYNIEILSIEVPQKVDAGNNVAIDIVLKNRGYRRLDDLYVITRVPELGIERKVYFGDLTPVDCDDDDCDKEDAVERRVYLPIPYNARAGIYDLELEAYNADSTSTLTKNIIIGGVDQSNVLVVTPTRNVAVGQEAIYELVIVNPGNKIRVYNIVPEETKDFVVIAEEPVVTVSADSSKVVRIRARPVKGSEEGTYSFAVNVNSDDELVKRASLNVVITGKARTASSVVILTIVLVIVFLVLLIVLIVLLTRKPAKTEELGESYY